MSLVFICRKNPGRSRILLFPDRPRFCRYIGKIADHPKNLGRVGKVETLPIFQICPRPSQMIRNSCFHKSAKSGTVGKQQNPRSSGIFPTYEKDLKAPDPIRLGGSEWGGGGGRGEGSE